MTKGQATLGWACLSTNHIKCHQSADSMTCATLLPMHHVRLPATKYKEYCLIDCQGQEVAVWQPLSHPIGRLPLHVTAGRRHALGGPQV